MTLLPRAIHASRVATASDSDRHFHLPTLDAHPLALLKRLGLWKGKIVLSFHGSDVGNVRAIAQLGV